MTPVPKAKLPVPGVNATLNGVPFKPAPPWINHASASFLTESLVLYQAGTTSILSLLRPNRASLSSVELRVDVRFIVKTTGRRLDLALDTVGPVCEVIRTIVQLVRPS